MAKKKNTKTRKKDYNDKSIRSIDKNLDNSKVFDTKKLYAKHADDSSLEDTNVAEFHFDDTMLNDFDSLDTSFLDGSSKNKTKKAKKEFKKRAVNKKIKVKKVRTTSMNVVAFIIIILLAVLLGGILTYIAFYDKFNTVKVVTKTEIKEKKVADENIVFLGDSIFEFYDVEKYYPDNRVVNSGINGNTTRDLLDNMDERVYRYNPSKTVILIGTNDIHKHYEDEEIVDNIDKIIKKIKKNRKLSDIYLLSILPINREDDKKIELDKVDNRTNKRIKSLNKDLVDVAKDNEVTYIDAFDGLIDDEGNLKLDYTEEGLHLTDEGYETLTAIIDKVINK